ncbi:mannosyltransferase [Nocardia vermiculata]|uniref:Mannosyltransferase n=1 Tax=Nocardia vermiculata TaxID=257274 RepID=A0A846XV97_9NOCA|nr:mannosyltransferase [Nocardia vermiculata]
MTGGVKNRGPGGRSPAGAKRRQNNTVRHLRLADLRVAGAILAVSVLARLVLMLVLPHGLDVVDLRVYVDGAANLGSGRLYDFVYADKTPDFPLPFTYPPFAALVFYPLHFLPFGLVTLVWFGLIVVALYACVRLAFALLFGAGAREPKWRAAALVWTAVGVWLEPTRTTLDYGQVNVFLVLAGLAAAYSARSWLSGLLVGVAAGVKLTPGVTGLYFLARRRWSAAVWSVVVFGATIGVSFLISSSETRTYFGPLLGDANRIGPVGSVVNQSLRGALSRILGHDAGAPWSVAGHELPFGPWWLGAVVLTSVLAWFAWRAVASDDRLGVLLVVQLFGLMVSPISWSHHWVWLLPLMMWLVYGPLRSTGSRVLAGFWMVTTLVGIPWILTFFQPTIWEISRPGVLAWLGAIYVFGVVGTFVWIIRAGARRSRPSPVRPAPEAVAGPVGAS